MKVLSIKEPFASLIKIGKKKIETRSWKTNYRGELYIHASLTKPKEDARIKRLNGMINPNPGYITCKCQLKDCIYMDEEYINRIKNTEEYMYGRYEIGRYAWIIEDVALVNPILVKGKLGIWNLDLEKEVESNE